MCIGCYEDYESPTVDTPEIRRVAGIIATDVFEYSYGPLHIIVEDWNLEDEHAKFCYYEALKDGRHIEVAFALLNMSEAERASCLGLVDGFWA